MGGVSQNALAYDLLSPPPPPDTNPEGENTPPSLVPPKLPDNPTPYELGANTYFYFCMPCHGDKGQGLTDEWRQVRVEDHRNDWGNGCHGGRPKDQGFPTPHRVPGLQDLSHFKDTSSLPGYLQSIYPLQSPGSISDDEYIFLSAYLFHQGGRPQEAEAISYFTDGQGGWKACTGNYRGAFYLLYRLDFINQTDKTTQPLPRKSMT